MHCALKFLLVLTVTPIGATLAEPYKAKPGPHAVEVIVLDWKDEARSREIPVKIYAPKSGDSLPVVIYSHGLGGTRDGYEYLGRHWASHGYVVVHLQHKGSDDAVWKGSKQPLAEMKKAAADVKVAIARPLDVRFALDQAESLNTSHPSLKRRLDLSKVGVSGHSFGSFTTLASGGMTFVPQGGVGNKLDDSRVKAIIPMSSPVPRNRDSLEKTYASITVPSLHMTGTLDDSPINDIKAADRRLPYDHSVNSERYLITFIGGDHMIFSGRARGMGDGSNDAKFQDLIRQTSVAFWDAHLRYDADAKKWLADGGMKKLLGESATLESKKAGEK
jgi:dienelactone hydrolase